MKSSIKFIIIYLLFSHYVAFSQCYKPETQPFKTGEKLKYTVQYNLNFIWFNAGEVIFRVDTITNKKGIRFYHFISTGRSLPSYDWIFKVRDKYEAITFYSSLKPIFFVRNTSEGSTKIINKYHFKYKQKKIYAQIHHFDSIPYNKTLTIKNCPYDALSSAYLLRSINLTKFGKNKKITLNMVIDGKIFPITIKYLKKETIKINDTTLVKSLKFSTPTIKGSIFSGKDDIYVWISDDKNKIPIKIEASILVGKVVVFLNKYQNLKYKPEAFTYNAKK